MLYQGGAAIPAPKRQRVTREKEAGSMAPFLAHTDHQVQVVISYLGLLGGDRELNTSKPFSAWPSENTASLPTTCQPKSKHSALI